MSCFMEFGNPTINSLSLLNWGVGHDRQHIILSSTTFMDVGHPKTFYLYLYTQNER